ncbi:hypothetical protein [Abiotrophia defectiva]|uniref:hypothetical protein n=1 Tax=Abiotrophia defectiva TaxID=46125 RepID=UPI0028D27F2B|nr:hypothetical protein [Abiotrophia defectiva]
MRVSIFTVIISCVFSVISGICLYPALASLWGYFEINNLLPSVVDFLGNIIISFSSAFIAYVVSKKQIEKSERKTQIEFKLKNDIMLKRLAKELELNIKLIEVSLEQNAPEELRNIEDGVWNWVFKHVDLPSDIFDKAHDIYYTLKILRSSCSSLNKEELESNASDYINKIKLIRTNIIDYIDKGI